MAKEVIQYIQEIEMQIAAQESETKQVIDTIKAIGRQEISQLHQQFEEKLATHRAQRESQKDEQLALDESYQDQQVAHKTQGLEKKYHEKQEQLTKQIVEEVLNQYGYRQNEKADTVS